jgi:TIR domain
MNSSTKHSGAWIFVSHSHHDLVKVREIRNELERRGCNPLLFFLKCLDADNALLPQLIRDEIKARNWFVLCNSRAARRSKWVREEIQLVKAVSKKPRKNVVVINLERNLQPELKKLERLSKRSTVFLSYARQDQQIAKRVRRALLQHDFGVWFDEATTPGQDWAAAIHSAIDAAVERGFVIVLLSAASLTSQWCKRETEYALRLAARSRRRNIIPVVVAPFLREALPPALRDIQWFDLTTGPWEERIAALIRSLKTREMD